MNKMLQHAMNAARAIQSDMDALGVGKPATLPMPVDDIERLLRSYDSVHGHQREARLLVRRVQKWLDSTKKGTVSE